MPRVFKDCENTYAEAKFSFIIDKHSHGFESVQPSRSGDRPATGLCYAAVGASGGSGIGSEVGYDLDTVRLVVGHRRQSLRNLLQRDLPRHQPTGIESPPFDER